MTRTTGDRLRENAAETAGTVVTGIWLAALFTGQDWWLAAMLLGYLVVVPVVALLFGDGDDRGEWWDGGRADRRSPGETDSDATTGSAEPPEANNREALETLRERYARGELTDEQFERKLERLLEPESLEDLEDRDRDRERERERSEYPGDGTGFRSDPRRSQRRRVVHTERR